MWNSIAENCVLDFFVSMGLVIGGALFGGLAALLTHHDPQAAMNALASDLKVWAIVAALGGSMDVLRVIDRGVFGLHIGPMIRQLIYLFAAFLGCHVGYIVIQWLTEERSSS
ncbi:YtrH family sporulation protein [Alicyclobacillus sendaiensis]|uniref:YtrH family sporulation protein n=1 Tax=Alicyclobacillus sendaiensis TaxID=192387 RepID=UPI0026F41807|nr:YtrH family sporulation protein [Alicyclobacillus sendaiensis]